MRPLHLALLVAGLAGLSACSKPAGSPPVSPASAPSPVAAASEPAARDPWLGRWQGPEGTFLEVSGGPGTYDVTIQNLDGPRRFEAKEASGTLVFSRDGVVETVRPGGGPDTGMKWLAEKRDCLVVKAGEGYCRG